MYRYCCRGLATLLLGQSSSMLQIVTRWSFVLLNCCFDWSLNLKTGGLIEYQRGEVFNLGAGVCVQCETKPHQPFLKPDQAVFLLTKVLSHVYHLLQRLYGGKALHVTHRDAKGVPCMSGWDAQGQSHGIWWAGMRMCWYPICAPNYRDHIVGCVYWVYIWNQSLEFHFRLTNTVGLF